MLFRSINDNFVSQKIVYFLILLILGILIGSNVEAHSLLDVAHPIEVESWVTIDSLKCVMSIEVSARNTEFRLYRKVRQEVDVLFVGVLSKFRVKVELRVCRNARLVHESTVAWLGSIEFDLLLEVYC